MRKIFIADAHLRQPHDPNYVKLLHFLEELEGNTDTLFILGDLFEFWIGYRTPPYTHYYPVLEQLRRLVETGTRIEYFEGNHDFHMGPFFKEALKARVYPEPAILDLDGRRAYLCHGDQINKGDPGYRLLRFVLHNRLSGAMVPIIPVKLVSRIAERMGSMSRQGHHQRRSKWDYAAILRAFATERFREGCDIVIAGHFHTPFLENRDDGAGILLSLGDWITHFTYGEWKDGQLTLKSFP